MAGGEGPERRWGREGYNAGIIRGERKSGFEITVNGNADDGRGALAALIRR